jgi:hypothetical protein
MLIHSQRVLCSRALIPGTHFLPVDRGKVMCQEIKKHVEWGNLHPEEVRRADTGLVAVKATLHTPRRVMEVRQSFES